MGEMAEYYEDMHYVNYLVGEHLREEREELLSRGIWTTKEGNRIPVKDMTVAHYENTLAFLRRRKQFALVLDLEAWRSK